MSEQACRFCGILIALEGTRVLAGIVRCGPNFAHRACVFDEVADSRNESWHEVTVADLANFARGAI